MKIKLRYKLLAAFLAIITLVGVFPMSVLAIEASDEYTAPDAEQIKERLGTHDRLVYFNDFDSTTGDTDFNTGAVTDGVSRGVESRVGAIFYEADTLTVENAVTPVNSITASNGACVMITTNARGETEISVSDPTNSLTNLTLSVNITGAHSLVSADENVTVLFDGDNVTLKADCAGNVGNTYSITVK